MSQHQVIHNEDAGRFEIHLDGHVAYTEYRPTERGLLFPRTDVPRALEGQGIGGELARAGLEYARGQGQQVLPVCTFIAGFIRRHPEYHALVHPLYRSALHLDDAELERELEDTFPASDPLSITLRED